MTMIVNKAPEAPPPPPSPVADRAWLERADHTLRAVRFLIVALCIITAVVSVLSAFQTNGVSLVGLFAALAWFLSAEVVVIIARSVVATAWAARKPDAHA